MPLISLHNKSHTFFSFGTQPTPTHLERKGHLPITTLGTCQLSTRWSLLSQTIWPGPESFTVVTIPDGGCGIGDAGAGPPGHMLPGQAASDVCPGTECLTMGKRTGRTGRGRWRLARQEQASLPAFSLGCSLHVAANPPRSALAPCLGLSPNHIPLGQPLNMQYVLTDTSQLSPARLQGLANVLPGL